MSSEIDHCLHDHHEQCELMMNGYSYDAATQRSKTRESTEKHRKSNRMSDNPLRLATHSLRQALPVLSRGGSQRRDTLSKSRSSMSSEHMEENARTSVLSRSLEHTDVSFEKNFKIDNDSTRERLD